MTYVSKSVKELETSYPITSGLVAKTTKQEGRVENLVAETGTLVLRRNRVGIR